MVSREAFIALNMIEGVGPVRARSLLEYFGDAPKILAASKNELLRVRNIGDDTAEKISNWEKSIDLAGELKRIADFGCHVLIQSDENYPANYEFPERPGLWVNTETRRRGTWPTPLLRLVYKSKYYVIEGHTHVANVQSCATHDRHRAWVALPPKNWCPGRGLKIP